MSQLRVIPEPHACLPHHCGGCDRFGAYYRLSGTFEEARAKAEDLVVEQTIEFPLELVTDDYIRQQIVGRIDHIAPDGDSHIALISFPNDATGLELTQLLNVLFGNISLKAGVRIEALKDCANLYNRFRGPRFGRDGLRARTGAAGRALLCTAIKPLGLSATELAQLAYRFAKGGIDLIKDDHGLTNQAYAPFEERVLRCTEAVAKANAETGLNCTYVPNVTASGAELHRRARFAKDAGAQALLVCPGLTGLDAMRGLADDDSIALPLLAHPALLGSFVTSASNGISHAVLFGQLMRLAGADVTIYPHAGGRFAFTEADCQRIREATAAPMGELRPIFPAPGGGMTLRRSEELRAFYGSEVVFLVGGDLLRNGPDIEATCARFRALVQA